MPRPRQHPGVTFLVIGGTTKLNGTQDYLPSDNTTNNLRNLVPLYTCRERSTYYIMLQSTDAKSSESLTRRIHICISILAGIRNFHAAYSQNDTLFNSFVRSRLISRDIIYRNFGSCFESRQRLWGNSFNRPFCHLFLSIRYNKGPDIGVHNPRVDP